MGVTERVGAGGFVDIHCHVLPGIDDGARDRAEAVEMVHMAHEQGTVTIVTTPHNFPRSHQTVLEESRHRIGLLRRAAAERDLNVDLLTGQEIRITRGLTQQLESGNGATINATRYVLAEPPFNSMPDYVEEEITSIISLGYRPVLAHPERNTIIQRDPDIVRRLIGLGALTQMNTGSLFDHYGPGSREAGEYLLQQEMIHVIATDAHGSTGPRVPNMRAGFDRVAELTDESRAWALARDNPLAITEEREIPYRPAGLCSRCGNETAARELAASGGRCEWCRSVDEVPWEED